MKSFSFFMTICCVGTSWASHDPNDRIELRGFFGEDGKECSIYVCEEERARLFEYNFSWGHELDINNLKTRKNVEELIQFYARTAAEYELKHLQNHQEAMISLEEVLKQSEPLTLIPEQNMVQKLDHIRQEVKGLVSIFHPASSRRKKENLTTNIASFRTLFDRCDAVAVGILAEIEYKDKDKEEARRRANAMRYKTSRCGIE